MENKRFRRVTGIILGTKDVSESDKVVVLFSPELGKSNLIAYGANRFKSRFSNRVCLSNVIRGWVKFSLTSGKFHSIEDVEVLANFFDEFRKTPMKLFSVNLITELVNLAVPQEVFDESLYNLLLKCFSKLVEAEGENESFMVLSGFLVIFLRLQGILPYIKNEKEIDQKTKSFVISLLKENRTPKVDRKTKLDFLKWFEKKVKVVTGSRKIISLDLVTSFM